ncbi:MAG: hypothetical protein K6D56_04075 [Clostridia bacterium]|jgi:hypothetical protein|nr:hypothetical protein [Clostridia bacterium]
MKYTSSEANKLLKQLKQEHDYLTTMEMQSREFNAAMGEDVESVRPAYDYAGTQEALAAVEKKIRTVKHAVNVFNATHEVPGFDMTIDEMLVYLPQLSARKFKLQGMMSRLPKVRESASGFGNNKLIDYNYANYDIQAVEKDHAEVDRLLQQAQTALDLLNTTETMEIDI